MVHITRCQDAPPSLEKEKKKQSGKYNLPDVMEQLNTDFHGKCYLCEAPVYDPQVEHLRPRTVHPELTFEWNNLFFSCPHCNNLKSDKYDGMILDCCQEETETLLEHCLEYPGPEEKNCLKGRRTVVVKAAPSVSEENEKRRAETTAKLITDCFVNGDTGTRQIACGKRFDDLRKQMDSLYLALEKYLKQKKEGKPVTRTLHELAGLLERPAPFAGFTRTYVRQNLEHYPDLEQYIELWQPQNQN